jgi:CheY-like chemotaxis protein
VRERGRYKVLSIVINGSEERRMPGTSETGKGKHTPTTLILVVEDDADIGTIIVQAIQSELPYQVKLVTDGFQALKVLMDIKPQLLLFDYGLPGMNGLELYDRLYAKEGLENIPTLCISANAPTKELKKRHIELIEKPFELDELIKAIEKLLS